MSSMPKKPTFPNPHPYSVQAQELSIAAERDAVKKLTAQRGVSEEDLEQLIRHDPDARRQLYDFEVAYLRRAFPSGGASKDGVQRDRLNAKYRCWKFLFEGSPASIQFS